MKATIDVINRLPQVRLDLISLHEKLQGTKSLVSYFQVFRRICYIFIPNQECSKFDKKVVQCIFVSYDNQHKRWRCCDPIL